MVAPPASLHANTNQCMHLATKKWITIHKWILCTEWIVYPNTPNHDSTTEHIKFPIWVVAILYRKLNRVYLPQGFFLWWWGRISYKYASRAINDKAHNHNKTYFGPPRIISVDVAHVKHFCHFYQQKWLPVHQSRLFQ